MIIYSAPGCAQCAMAIKYAGRLRLDYEVRSAVDHREELIEMGFQSAPVVVLDDGEAFSGFRPDRLASAR